MEENSKSMKITYAKNLSKFNFNTTLSVPIDSNVNIKTILDVNTYLFDHKVECGNGKAIISGKIGVKVLYIDTDNMTNTITDSQSFSDTYLDSSITSETFLNVNNFNIVNNILSSDGSLKINCDLSISPVAYLNLSLSNNLQANEMLITKKSELTTSTISCCVNTKFEHVTNLETKDTISKVLCNNSYFTPEKTTAQDGFAIVEGKMVSCVVYETTTEDTTTIKEMHETSNIKCDVEIENLTKENLLDLSFMIDKSQDEISTEFEDDNNIVSIKQKICVCGVVLKNVALDIVDDVYSTENDIETTTTKREYTKKAENFCVSDTISNEISLSGDETAIDEVIANLNITPEITNTYIKDNHIFIEGIVTSNLTYIDENKEFKHKQLEIPFIINTKIYAENSGCTHNEISIVDSRIKIKRGTIIDMEYSLFACVTVYEKETHEMIDNFTIGKQLDFSKYDFQIFIAKPNETLWELCKRIKISPDDIHKHNKDLPLVMLGGEKVVIKR